MRNTIEKAQYTSGPWQVQDEYEGTFPIDAPISSTGYDESIEVCRVSQQTDEGEANARLIAAAPELLAALRRAVPWLGKMIADGAHLNSVLPRDCEIALAQAEAAIAKAGGKPA